MPACLSLVSGRAAAYDASGTHESETSISELGRVGGGGMDWNGPMDEDEAVRD